MNLNLIAPLELGVITKNVLNPYLAGACVIHESKRSPICLSHW